MLSRLRRQLGRYNRSMRNYAAKDVDEYIASASWEAQPILVELRELMKATVPGVEESISWGIPFYKYHGMLGGFSVFTHHVSFGMGGPDLAAKDRDELQKKGYKTGKKTIQIRFDQRIPAAIIRRMIREQARANERRH